MKRQANILMLGGAKRISLARLLIDAGKRMGIEVKIVKEVPIACVGTVVEGVRWSDPGIYDNLSAVIRQYGIGIVLPFVDGAIEICSRLKEIHPEVFIPVSPYEVAHAMFDKAEAAALFERNGFAIPATYSKENCSFPAILKPREGSASKGIITVNNAEELDKITDIDKYLIQEYIANRDEYTVDCYVSAISKRVLCTVPRLRISTSGGEVDRTITRRIPELIGNSTMILEKLGFEGPVTIQFIHDKARGRYLLMEINPRLGGGVVCSINAGAAIPEMILTEWLGREAAVCGDWRGNALMARYFSEVMFYEDENR